MEPARQSKRLCCVVGCNSSDNSNRDLQFYRFPQRWFEKARRKAWIDSVRRINVLTKGMWEPTESDRICSSHFVGHKKSNSQLDISYNPTIFPKEYDIFAEASPPDLTFDHSPDIDIDNDAQSTQDVEELPRIEGEDMQAKADFSCQTDNYESDYNTQNSFSFECIFSTVGDVGTQITTPSDYVPMVSNKKNKCVGNDEPLDCHGFHGYISCENSDKALNSMAGVTHDRFIVILSFLSTITHGNAKLSKENRLLLFLTKMKLGISNVALGVLFAIHETSVSRIFLDVLGELSVKMKHFVFWPSREAIDLSMPQSFKQNYPKCRSIIDCTEIRIQQPAKVNERIHTYSQYKGTYTAKFLIGIAPAGFISFVSKCYGGRTTDAFITNDSGFLKLLEPNDVVLADKGFPGIKCDENVVVVMPPFVHEGSLTLEEVEETYSIASVRIHVERSIQRIKIYKILEKIPYNLMPHLDHIVLMCCVLTNLQPPTIHDQG